MKIYIGQLPYTVTEDEIKEVFTEYGEIASLNLIMDKFSGQSKGFGFIDMPNNSEADQAIKGLNKTMYKGREIKVNQAEERRKKMAVMRTTMMDMGPEERRAYMEEYRAELFGEQAAQQRPAGRPAPPAWVQNPMRPPVPPAVPVR